MRFRWLPIAGAVLLASYIGLEFASAICLSARERVRHGRSFVEIFDRRWEEFRNAWRPPVLFGHHDPLVTVRHIPNGKYGALEINSHGIIHNGHNDPLLNSFPEKPAGLVRIILLGGSTMAGSGSPDNRSTISAYLERELNSRLSTSGKRYQVLNFGSAGGYTGAELQKTALQIIHYKPDIIVTMDGFNDAWDTFYEHYRQGLDHPVVSWSDYHYQYFNFFSGLPADYWKKPKRILTWTQLFIAQWIREANKEKKQAIYNEYPWYQFSGKILKESPYNSKIVRFNLLAMAEISRISGSRFLAYLQPQPFAGKNLTIEELESIDSYINSRVWGTKLTNAEFRKRLIEAFDVYSSLYADLKEKYRHKPTIGFHSLRDVFGSIEKTVYVDVIHFNELGAKAIAERFAGDILNLLHKDYSTSALAG